MIGINSYLKCPCKFAGIVDLGITQFVTIKGQNGEFAVRNCPECGKAVAFRINRPEQAPKNVAGSPEMVRFLKELINSLPDEEKIDVAHIQAGVLKSIATQYGETYADILTGVVKAFIGADRHIDFYSNIEEGYDLSLLDPDDIEVVRVVCY